MANRLYYDDPYLRAFDAAVTSVDAKDDRLFVTLDRTAFYPTSGGQPFDTGTLAGFRVVDVLDQEDGSIVHVLGNSELRTEPLELATRNPLPGTRVHGSIDWPRRFDHMQQHTGQHVLSAAFERRFHVGTVSFHLGADVSTIDLSREVRASEIAAAEDEANRIVWEDRAVNIRYASSDEAAGMALRKEPKRSGTLRLIDIEGFDLSACGGTHVARTGAIGVIAVPAWERFKGGYRIEFLCGGRALNRFRTWRETIADAVRLLSVASHELPGAIERMQVDAKEQKRAIAVLQNELARFRADELAAGAETVRVKADTSYALVARALDADANALKTLASALTARSGYIVVLASTGQPTVAVVARSADVAVSAQQILAALIAKFGGRGGGRPELAQGGGLNGSAGDILAAARQVVAGINA
jgi:alanyl-tRNA synthetase